MENKKYYFVSFGGPRKNYYIALNRIIKEVETLKIFNNIIQYTDIDLKKDSNFWNKNWSFIENNKRGYGYWVWKPYIILQTLNKMDNGDILLYCDAGCEINNNPLEMKYLLEKCKNEHILYTSTYEIERRWNKRDLLNFMNMDSPNFIDTMQGQSGVIFINKNDKTYNLIKEWYDIASSNYHYIDDTKSLLQNYPDFREHRHDQSVFSLLTKKYNFNNSNNVLHDYKPIITARNCYKFQ